MKRKATKQSEVIQMKLLPRDKDILDKLQLKNRTLRRSDIFRLALDTLAEKQGIVASGS
jgi:hypothetical protein